MSLHCTLYFEKPASGSDYAPDEMVGIERRWGLLNFLLSGSNEPTQGNVPCFLTSDWTEVAEEADLIDASQIAEINAWLVGVEDSEVLARLDAEAMVKAGVYDAPLTEADAEDCREELARDLSNIRMFIARANKLGSSVVRVIC